MLVGRITFGKVSSQERAVSSGGDVGEGEMAGMLGKLRMLCLLDELWALQSFTHPAWLISCIGKSYCSKLWELEAPTFVRLGNLRGSGVGPVISLKSSSGSLHGGVSHLQIRCHPTDWKSEVKASMIYLACISSYVFWLRNEQWSQWLEDLNRFSHQRSWNFVSSRRSYIGAGQF